MQLEPGDMQFVYNHNQLHDRTDFIDWPDPAKRRHLMALALLEGDRPLPACFRQRYGRSRSVSGAASSPSIPD